MASRIRLVSFDAFNTLYKPKGSLSSQYTQEAVRHGLNVTTAAVRENFGLAYKKQLDRAPFYGMHLGMASRTWWEELVYATFLGAGATKKDLDPVFDSLFDTLYTRFMTKDGYTTFPDVRRTLSELRRRGFHMGVISNSDERLPSVIKSLELDPYFDFVLPSCAAGYEKPDAQIFQKACEITGVRPEEALHVGDDEDKDYYGARNAGWNATLLKRCKLSYQDSAPDLVPELARCKIPQTIMGLQELCSILVGTHDSQPARDHGAVAASS
ncbi:HAD-like domain-containing protein [Fennellomyces sp. T-0311]|nr:HAD-like domain-containing protein [Fennellomyces sp. T-0311]